MAEDESPDDAPAVTLILLPDGHKLHSWKVRNGSPCQQGETVALAVPCDKSSTSTDTSTDPGGKPIVGSTPLTEAEASGKNESSGGGTKHKRPTRRRRPAPSAESEHAAGQESIVATSPSITHSLSDPEHSKPAPQVLLKHEHVPIVAPCDGILKVGTPPSATSTPLLLGYVEPCSHPTVIDNLCAVCGKAVKASITQGNNNDSDEAAVIGVKHTRFDNDTSNEWEMAATGKNMSQVTVAGGVTVRVSEEESQRMAEQDNERLRKQRKLALVLDLDHTLVHATNDPRAKEHLNEEDVRSLILPATEHQPPPGRGQYPTTMTWMQHFVKLRPHVKEFLEMVQSSYELVVYTAGTRYYAEQIAMTLARHLVGASCDQIDLDQMRRKVFRAEEELKKEMQKKAATFNDDNVNTSANDEIDESKGMSESKDEGPAKKKSRQEPGEDNADPATKSSNKSDDKDAHNENEFSMATAGADTTEAKAGQKRKRVTFGEPPATLRSDHATQDKIDQLRNELDEAMRLDRLAMNVRQRLFGSRVHSRTELGDLGRDVKSLRRIFPCGGSMAAVVDDREDVWANAADNKETRKGEPPDNLLLVRPYHWDTFLGFADVNNAAGTYVSAGQSRVSSELDQQLLWTRDVLMRLHDNYYTFDGPNRPGVPETLKAMRKNVLKGCVIVLSGLVPLHKQNMGSDHDQPRPSAVRYAESLGAKVVSTVTSSVTHVVGAKDGTDKINSARRIPGCFVVKPSWLMECVWTLTRRDERQHLLRGASEANNNSSASGISPIGSKKSDENSSSEEDDDDFAAEFENEMMEEK